MGLQEDVKNALLALKFENPKIELEKTVSGKIGGVLITKTFTGMSQLDRQNTVWDHLEKELGKEKITRIVAVLTLTPDEAEGAFSKPKRKTFKKA